MKRIGTIALAVLLTGGAIGSNSAHAVENPTQVIKVEEDTTNYMHFSGIVKEIETEENGIRLTVENEEEMIMILRINEDSLLFDSGTTEGIKQSDLKVGTTVDAYYDKNKPMLLIYPPTITPEIVVVKDESLPGTVKISKYDETFLSLDGELKLNIGEETILLNQQGEEIKEEDLHGKDLAVFYTWTTFSLPPQTSPSKIIALDYGKEEMTPVEEIIEADHYVKNGVKMIPLRKVAEELGYDVLAQAKVSGALITKGNLSFTIRRGNQVYGFNKSIGKFEIAPELTDKKTYVPVDFLELLIQN